MSVVRQLGQKVHRAPRSTLNNRITKKQIGCLDRLPPLPDCRLWVEIKYSINKLLIVNLYERERVRIRRIGIGGAASHDVCRAAVAIGPPAFTVSVPR